MTKTLRVLLAGAIFMTANGASAGNLETLFNSLTHRQREYVQIRLRAPGFLQSEIDGQFGLNTAEAIRVAASTPGYRQYRRQARVRGVLDEETIALYYVMSDVYLHTIIQN